MSFYARIQRWALPLQLACSLTKDGFHSCRVIDRVSQSLNCLTNAFPLFPFISFPASQISHLRPREIQYLICEVYCLSKWKAVDATDNCYRQKDNYRSFSALSERMTRLCWFRFKSSDVLYALLAVPFLRGLLFDGWFGVINIVASKSESFWKWTPAAVKDWVNTTWPGTSSLRSSGWSWLIDTCE